MTYSVLFTETAERQLKKLDKNLQQRILLALERIRIRPYGFVKKLSGYPYYRLRVGDYRVILDIKTGQLILIVIEVGHRKGIYK